MFAVEDGKPSDLLGHRDLVRRRFHDFPTATSQGGVGGCISKSLKAGKCFKQDISFSSPACLFLYWNTTFAVIQLTIGAPGLYCLRLSRQGNGRGILRSQQEDQTANARQTPVVNE